jgi:hypothetical protein
MTFGQMTPRAGLLPGSYGLIVLVVLLCPFGASTAQGATCLVDDAGGNDANSCCTPMMGACKTINAAVTKAAAGDTVSVAAGTYTEPAAQPLPINKTLTLLGAQAGVDARTRMGPESVVADMDGTSVSASNVVIDGFTFQDSTNAAFTGFGIDLNPGVSGTQIVNNIFQNNIAGIGISNLGPSQLLIRHNLFQNDNDTGGASGDGIYTDQFVGGTTVTNVLVEENAFKGNNDSGIDLSNTDSSMGSGVFNIEVRNNSFDMNGRAFDIFNTHMMMFHDNSVTNSTLLGGALRIFDFNSDITIVNNNLAGGVGERHPPEQSRHTGAELERANQLQQHHPLRSRRLARRCHGSHRHRGRHVQLVGLGHWSDEPWKSGRDRRSRGRRRELRPVVHWACTGGALRTANRNTDGHADGDAHGDGDAHRGAAGRLVHQFDPMRNRLLRDRRVLQFRLHRTG